MLLATCRVSRVPCQVCDVPAYTTCEYCDLEQKLCKPGCETDDNCAAGDVCVSHNCAAGAGSAAACHVSRVTCHVSRSGGERDREHHHQHRVLLRLYRLRQPHRLRGGRGGRVPPGGAAGHQQQQHPALVTCQGEYGTECTSLGLDNLEMVDYDNGKEAFFDGTPDDDGDDDGKGNMQ